jgi:CIC family chloride channel protein
MLTVVISTLVAQRLLGGESIYTLKLTRRGVRLQRGRDVDILQSVMVEEVMRYDVETVDMDLTLAELSDIFSRSRHHGLPVLNRSGKLWGIVTISDLDQAVLRQLPSETPLTEIGIPRQQLLTVFPDEAMGEALTRMGRRGIGRLPVVSRADSDHLLVLIRRPDIFRAYDLDLSRRAELHHRAKSMSLDDLDGTEFIDLTLKPGDCAVGKSVQDMAQSLPHECLLVSVRRNGRVFIPHGDTIFQPQDHITAFIRSQDAELLHQCLREKAK